MGYHAHQRTALNPRVYNGKVIVPQGRGRVKVAPVRKLREVRAEGVAILDELVRATDAEASRAVATERA